jgi:Flp pilus assembly pilin Flp
MIEYTLLLAFVALAAGAAWVGIAPATSTIVSIRNNDLISADTIAH